MKTKLNQKIEKFNRACQIVDPITALILTLIGNHHLAEPPLDKPTR